jgi:hypothetical protein
MITGRHPFILKPFADHKEYIIQLKNNEMNIPPKIRSKLSIPMQQLFDLIIRMVAKE